MPSDTGGDSLRARLRSQTRRRTLLDGPWSRPPARRHLPASGRSSRLSAAKDSVAFLLGVATFAFGVYQFVFVNIILARRQPPALALHCTVEDVGRRGGTEAVKVTVSLRNTSQTRVYVLAGWFNVYGARCTPLTDPSMVSASGYNSYLSGTLKPDTGGVWAGGSVEWVPRYWQEDGTQVIDCGKFVEEKSWFEPGEEYGTSFLVYVPVGRLDLVRVRLSTVMSKDEDVVRTEWRMAPDGGLTALVERQEDVPLGDRLLRLIFVRGDGIAWLPIGDDRRTQQWMKKNAVSTDETVSELSLWPPGTAPKAASAATP